MGGPFFIHASPLHLHIVSLAFPWPSFIFPLFPGLLARLSILDPAAVTVLH